MPARSRATLWLLALLALGLTIYWSASGAAFLNFDDDRLLWQNPHFARGGFSALAAILDPRHTIAETYLPVSNLSLWLDWLLFGSNPFGAHLHSLLLQVLAAWALFGLLRRLGVFALGAFAASSLFLAHPALVESVAWVSSRKDVLSGLLGLLALLCGVRWLEAGTGRRWLWGSAAFTLLACYAKGSAVVLPFWLLLLWLVVPNPLGSRRRGWPLVVAGALVAGLAAGHHAWLAEGEGTARWAATDRLAAMPGVFVHYLKTCVWPVQLDVLYPTHELLGRFAASPLHALSVLLAVLLAVGLLWIGRLRLAAAGVLLCLVALLPFNGWFPASAIAVADRYLYLPLVGVAVLLGGLMARQRWLVVPVLAASAGLACLAELRCRTVFGDSESLWTASLAQPGQRPEASFNLAVLLLGRNDPALHPRALALLERASRESVHPVHRLRAERLLAHLARERGSRGEALAHFGSARLAAFELGEQPAALRIWGDVSLELLACLREGDASAAVGDELLQEILQRCPSHPGATAMQVSEALVARLAQAGGGALDPAEPAVASLRKQLDQALAANPGDVGLSLVLGDWHRATGAAVEALRVFASVQRRQPREPAAFLRAAETYRDDGVLVGALGEVDKGLLAMGARPELLRLKAELLLELGRLDQARALLEEYRRWRPRDVWIQRQLAMVVVQSLERRMHLEPVASLASDLQQAVELWPEHPRLCFLRAFVALGERKPAAAAVHAEAALAAFPEEEPVRRVAAEAFKQHGLELLLRGERMPAMRRFRRSLSLGVPDFDAGSMPVLLDETMKRLFEQGIDQFQSGDAEGSVTSFEQARELFPDHPDVLFNLGLARLQLDEAVDAERLFARVEELHAEASRDAGLARYYRALALSQAGRRAEARQILEAFLAEHPRSAARQRIERFLEERGGG